VVTDELLRKALFYGNKKTAAANDGGREPGLMQPSREEQESRKGVRQAPTRIHIAATAHPLLVHLRERLTS
jgi:hypothetical protein